MPDEITQGEPAVAEPQPAGDPEPTHAPQEGDTPAAPSQQIPYARFKEVNDAKKAEADARLAAERRAAEAEARLAQVTQPQQPREYTLEDVYAAYEHGQITESQKDQWLKYLTKEEAKREAQQVIGQQIATVVATNQAAAMRDQYLKTYTGLTNAESQEYRALAGTYNELLARGRQAADPWLIVDALRMTFGPIKGQATTTREHSRQRADTFLEGSGGGGAMATHDAMKDVSDRQREYWKRQGYTKSRMEQEAKYKDVKSIDDYRRMARAK